MTMTKEEILSKAPKVYYEQYPLTSGTAIDIDRVDDIMDEYAKQEAIGFDSFRSENYNQVMPNGYESKAYDEANFKRRYTRHELFTIYQNSKQ